MGIAPREAGAGGGCGGSAVAGGGCVGLNTACSNKPSAYASGAEGSELSDISACDSVE